MGLNRIPHDLHALAEGIDRLVGISLETGERTHVVVRREAPVGRLGLALEPWPGMEGWVRAERLHAVVLHRPWRLPIDALPPDLGVLATHAPFDEHLGLGWNRHLAEQIGLHGVQPFGDSGGGAVGMIGTLEPVRWRMLLGQVEAVFGGVEECLGVPDDPDTVVTRIAVARAITGDLVGAAARAGATAYLTGELRHPARQAVVATGVAAVAIGHARSERWGLGLLRQLLAAEWPDLRIDLAPEGTTQTR